VLAGDETALPAIARLLDAWPGTIGADVVIEVASPPAVQDLPSHAGVTVQWVHGADAWVQAVRDLPWPDVPTFCWVAGESGAVRQVRRHLADDRHVPRDCLDATGYWRR
jgi:NADPH-dependent ferric siderophore reductase